MAKGPKVTSKKQALAIAHSEARKKAKSKKAKQRKIEAVMREFAAGQLRLGRPS